MRPRPLGRRGRGPRETAGRGWPVAALADLREREQRVPLVVHGQGRPAAVEVEVFVGADALRQGCEHTRLQGGEQGGG